MTTLGLLVCPESVQEEVERTRKGDRINYQKNSFPLNTVHLPPTLNSFLFVPCFSSRFLLFADSKSPSL
jgi:hypothetical protein